MAKKKKQALDNLFETGRISQTTHDAFNNDIHSVLKEIEKQQNSLLLKMQNTTQELDGQVKILESLLTNYEIQHAVGEIEEDIYQSEIHLLSNGLETARRELSKIKEAVSQLSPPVEPPTAEIAETTIDTILLDNESAELTTSPLNELECLNETSEDTIATPEPITNEPYLTMDNSIPEASEIETINANPQETPQIIDEAGQVADVVPEAVESELLIDEAGQVADVVPEAVESELLIDEAGQVADVVPEAVESELLIDEAGQVADVVPEAVESELLIDEAGQVADVVPEAVESELLIDEAGQVADVVPEAVESEFQPEQTNQILEETQNENEVDEWPQFVDEPVSFDEGPEIIQREPLFLNSINQTIEDMPRETVPEKREELEIESLTEEQDNIEDSNATDEETSESTEQY